MLIDKGEINVKEMRALRITINDLMEQLRIGGAPSINDVDFAVMESNGELSIIQKAEKRPLTAKDASIAADSEVMPSVFISDGIIYYENIRNSGWTVERMLMKLASLGIDDTSSVFPVSYTHLDVYKRQTSGIIISRSTRWISFFSMIPRASLPL